LRERRARRQAEAAAAAADAAATSPAAASPAAASAAAASAAAASAVAGTVAKTKAAELRTRDDVAHIDKFAQQIRTFYNKANPGLFGNGKMDNDRANVEARTCIAEYDVDGSIWYKNNKADGWTNAYATQEWNDAYTGYIPAVVEPRLRSLSIPNQIALHVAVQSAVRNSDVSAATDDFETLQDKVDIYAMPGGDDSVEDVIKERQLYKNIILSGDRNGLYRNGLYTEILAAIAHAPEPQACVDELVKSTDIVTDAMKAARSMDSLATESPVGLNMLDPANKAIQMDSRDSGNMDDAWQRIISQPAFIDMVFDRMNENSANTNKRVINDTKVVQQDVPELGVHLLSKMELKRALNPTETVFMQKYLSDEVARGASEEQAKLNVQSGFNSNPEMFRIRLESASYVTIEFATFSAIVELTWNRAYAIAFENALKMEPNDLQKAVDEHQKQQKKQEKRRKKRQRELARMLQELQPVPGGLRELAELLRADSAKSRREQQETTYEEIRAFIDVNNRKKASFVHTLQLSSEERKAMETIQTEQQAGHYLLELALYPNLHLLDFAQKLDSLEVSKADKAEVLAKFRFMSTENKSSIYVNVTEHVDSGSTPDFNFFLDEVARSRYTATVSPAGSPAASEAHNDLSNLRAVGGLSKNQHKSAKQQRRSTKRQQRGGAKRQRPRSRRAPTRNALNVRRKV
jgi:hypothetical protein